MTMDRGWELQVAVVAALEGALAIPVTTGIPSPAPARYCRVDGFSAAALETYRNRDRATHAFTVHVFDAPENGTSSLAWVREQMALAHGALQGLRLDDQSQEVRVQSGNVGLEPREDGVSDAHAWNRYAATIGG